MRKRKSLSGIVNGVVWQDAIDNRSVAAMAGGDKELTCLKRITSYVFPDEDACLKREPDNSLLSSSFYGFDEEGWRKLCDILAGAKPNENSNDFPDFVSIDSVLEHFEITATKEKRRGSEFKHQRGALLKSLREDVAEAAAESTPHIRRDSFECPSLDHGALLQSLRRNLENHAKSLKNYSESHNVDKAIFIIEHKEYGLWMVENAYGSVAKDRVYGNLRDQQKFLNYRMSRDSEALAILANLSKEIDFSYLQVLIASSSLSSVRF